MARYNPFEELSDIFDRMSRQLDATTESWDAEFGDWSLGGPMANLDVADHDEEYVVTVDLPGYTNDEVDVRVTDHTLHVEADHETAEEESDEHYIRRERHHRSVNRQVRLPETAETDAVTASMNHGVLTVTVPKAEPAARGHRIEIE